VADQDIDLFDYINENRRPPLLNKGIRLMTALISVGLSSPT